MVKHPPTVDQGGRPIEFGPRQRKRLLALLTGGMGNDTACRKVGICRATLYRTAQLDPAFADAYEAAKRFASDALVEEADALAHQALHATSGVEVAALSLKIKFLWWKAERIAPQRWGRKAKVHAAPRPTGDETDLAKRLAFLEALAHSS